MSISARKRRHRKIDKRIERHRFRRAEDALLRGDHPRNSHYGTSWSGVSGMRGKNLP